MQRPFAISQPPLLDWHSSLSANKGHKARFQKMSKKLTGSSILLIVCVAQVCITVVYQYNMNKKAKNMFLVLRKRIFWNNAESHEHMFHSSVLSS